MTLHGEQEGEEVDRSLAENNRKAWNGWICQGMDPEALMKAIEDTRIDAGETRLGSDGLAALTKRFGEVWKDRNGDGEIVPDLPDPGGYADLREIAFSNLVILEHAILRKTQFNGAIFGKPASFLRATFDEMTSFDDVTFGGTTSFSNATFRTKASFAASTFDGETIFSGVTFGEVTSFRGVIFGNSTSFIEADLGDISHFIGATFGDSTSFSGATFGDSANFNGANFGRNTFFMNATFGETTSFDGATFDTFVSFHNAKSDGLVSFKGYRKILNKQRTKFIDAEKRAAHFAATTLFSEAHFSGRVNFYQRRFGPYDGDTKDLSFANAIFEGPVSFEEAEFPHVLPVLSNTTLPQSTKVSAEPENWPKVPALYDIFDRTYRDWDRAKHKSAKASAAALRHTMSRQSLPEEEHFFFRREMFHAQRAEPWWKVVHVDIFDALSEYGFSIVRPLVWLAAVWALGVWVYSTATAFSWSIPTAAGYSFSAMFKFFGFQRTYLETETEALTGGYEVFAACQTVAGFVLLFFLGLGLRTRFRLR